MEFYTASLQHILSELGRIDLLIQLQVWRARQVLQQDEFQGLYVSEQEVNDHLSRPAGLPRWVTEQAPPALAEVRKALEGMASEISRRKEESLKRGVVLRLEELTRLFRLDPFDVDALLICMAPEMDLRYERLYSYLQDDVTKKRPSVDLVLNLLSPTYEAKLAGRARFGQGQPLLKYHLLHLFDDPSLQHPPLLGRYLKADDRIVAFLLDSDEVDQRLTPFVTLVAPEKQMDELPLQEGFRSRLVSLSKKKAGNKEGLIFYFQGPYGVGRQGAAEALCHELGKGFLIVDGAAMLNTGELTFQTAVRLAVREARLQDAALYWDGFDVLLEEDKQGLLKVLLQEMLEQKGLFFLGGNSPWEPSGSLRSLPFVRVEFSHPSYSSRREIWNNALNGNEKIAAGADVDFLASRFRLTAGQIRDAAATAYNLALWRDPGDSRVTMADLNKACRLHSNRRLASLAKKITPHYTWDDIILPPDRLQQLREICNSVKYRALVYSQWGFGRKLSLGKGLNVLFAGPSGTGKTMAAEILAGELGLDLYKIDLSTVISKYIGETEKNLARIFAEAETSNAILFFDEADALFGRRSEVRDSHDRYANIEISYLLQKMEEYEGVVILATNLKKNMDDAFVRRMHFTVEFPFPAEKDRRRIWERIWPEDTPRSNDIDLDFMARRFEIAGGNIRNIALAAAFLAADDGGAVNMEHLISATQREFQKMGKVVLGGEFEGYGGPKTRREENGLPVTKGP